jgi:hypothetical protein
MTSHSSRLASVILLLLSLFSFYAQARVNGDQGRPMVSRSPSEDCLISEAEREALLSLDYNSFDQSLPDGGWRKYQRCSLLTRGLLDAYTARHEKTLQKQQWDVLVWHSGQISAKVGDDTDAIDKMRQTLKPNEKPTDAFLWNPYAKATIAFLKKQRPALLAERKKLARGLSPLNRVNLRVVDTFVRCFQSTYNEAYFEGCHPPETNIERIRALAVPFDYRRPLPNEFFGLADFFRMKKVILVGEIHGTRAAPELFGNLVASVADSKSKTLAILEITQSSQANVDAFLKTGDESLLKKEPFFTHDFQDGRSSQAMVALLKSLARLPNVTVLCMDPEAGSMTPQERDTAMASFINAHRSGFDHTLVLTGNVHSSTEVGTAWDQNYRPMGSELKGMATDLNGEQLLNILIRSEKVDSWSCQGPNISDCRVYRGTAVPSDYSRAVGFQSYFIWEQKLTDGHNASIFIRSVKASPPLVDGNTLGGRPWPGN